MDRAPSHGATKTTQWLQDHAIKFIPKEKSLPNCLDMRLLEYAINADFRRKISEKVVTGVDRLESFVEREWEKFEITKIRKALLAWPKRLKMMTRGLGYQNKHIL